MAQNVPTSIVDATPAGDPLLVLADTKKGGVNPGGANAPVIGISSAEDMSPNPFSRPAATNVFVSEEIGGTGTDADADAVNAPATNVRAVEYGAGDYNDTITVTDTAGVITHVVTPVA